jgi:hypothetical protein
LSKPLGFPKKSYKRYPACEAEYFKADPCGCILNRMKQGTFKLPDVMRGWVYEITTQLLRE